MIFAGMCMISRSKFVEKVFADNNLKLLRSFLSERLNHME